eukprot:2776825-Prymnesium_polylepis.1
MVRGGGPRHISLPPGASVPVPSPPCTATPLCRCAVLVQVSGQFGVDRLCKQVQVFAAVRLGGHLRQ